MTAGWFGAPLLAAAGSLALAALPPSAWIAFRVGLAAVAVAVLAATALWLPGDPVRSAFALVVAVLGVTLSFGFDDASFGGIGGARLRLARAWPACMLAVTLAAALAPAPGQGLVALGAAGLLASVAAGCTRGQAASLAGWALLRVQALAVGVGLLGTAVATLSAPVGAALMMLAAGVVGGAAPFGGALARASGRTAPPLAAMVAGLLPLVAFGWLLRIRIELVRDGYGVPAGATLLGSGLLAMLLGAASAARAAPAERDAALGAALGGLVLAGFGVGGQAGVYAGLVCLLGLSVAAPAAVLARPQPHAPLRALTLLFAAGAPPAALFAGVVLLVEAAGRLAPLLVCALCPLLVVAIGPGRVRAGVHPRSAEGERAGIAVRGVLAAHLVLSVAIGVALPAVAGARLLDVAVALSGDP